MSLNNLAESYFYCYEQFGRIDDLNKAIILGRDCLTVCLPGHPDRPMCLDNVERYLISRWKKFGRVDDLNEAIVLGRDALSLCPPGHPDRSIFFNNLAGHFFYRYEHLGGIDDLNEAIVLGRESLSLCPLGHPLRSTCSNNLVAYISSRYTQLGEIDDLKEAIFLGWDALSLCPPGHPERSKSLNNLALCLCSRYNQLGKIDDLNEAIILCRDALPLCPPGHPHRAKSLNDLALCLSSRYKLLGRIDDLNEAIILSWDALSLCPTGHLHRSICLNNVGDCLFSRYKQLGGMDDLNVAIILGREALTHCPLGHPHRSMRLDNIGRYLVSRYKQLGGMEDLNEAIGLGRGALLLCPPGHMDRSICLNNLAGHLFHRYEQLGGIDDLNEGIVLSRGALSLRPTGHPDRPMSLGNIAGYLFSRYKRLGEVDDLNKAIVLGRKALSLRPPGHLDRAMSLNNIAGFLVSRYEQLGEISDLNEAIIFGRDALSLCPPGHVLRAMCLNNLAGYLFPRYEQLGEIDDLDEAIFFGREALSLRLTGHPERSRTLQGLAHFHLTRFAKLARVDDREKAFNLYTELQHVSQAISSLDLSAAKAWVYAAEESYHPTTLLAYQTALRLLAGQLAALPLLPQHLAVLKSLSSSLAVDAFSACLRNQSPVKAVELLEQGRGVFWSQLTRLYSPLSDVIASGPAGKLLADEFTRLSSLIRMALHSPDADQHDRVCHLNVELQKVASKIRELPNLSQFLLPALFSDLQPAACGGPVIIMNASKYSCDALVIFVDKDPIHIPLSVTREDVWKLVLKLRLLIKLAKTEEAMEMNKRFMAFLRELWDTVVFRVVDFLRIACLPQTHVWWCPTAEFSLLPLHAAAPYRKGEKGIPHLFISSYTTTLTALIRARRPSSLDSTMTQKHFVAIGQAQAPGSNELLCVGTELASIGQLVDGLAMFTRVEGEDSCISNASDVLHRNEWVHFSCHGTPNQQQPFESAFSLHDGPFTVRHIIQSNLKNPEFAYLSACHTTVGDQESPDEVIHLASAMQFAGFRSVIGTMWVVDDAEANKITSVFYTHMRDESGHLDYTYAALALRKTMRSLVNIPIDQRILYIHLGA